MQLVEQPVIKRTDQRFAIIDQAAITSNKPGFVLALVNGCPLKHINQFYNKRKAQLQARHGIAVRTINESHTSKCGFLDNEPIGHRDPYPRYVYRMTG